MDPRRVFGHYFHGSSPVRAFGLDASAWIAAQRVEEETKRREALARARQYATPTEHRAAGVDDAGRHGGGRHGGGHHGGGNRGGRGGFSWSTPDVVYVQPQVYDYDFCPPGFYLDEWGNCKKRPVEARGPSPSASLASVALDKVWPAIDPQGRSFKQAIQDSAARAESKAWTSSVLAVFDLIAMITGSALLSSSVKTDPNQQVGLRASAALDRTWEVLAKRAGYSGQDAQTITKSDPSSPDVRGALPILEIVIVVVAVAAVAAVYAWAIWKASEIIERQLAISAEEDELIRLHSEWQKIVDRHIADPSAPWTPEELQILKALEDAQAGVRTMMAPPKPAELVKPLDPTVLAVVGLAGAAGYFFFLRKPKS